MKREQIIQMARDAGSIDSEETIITVYAAFRAVTKEEDAKICEEECDSWQAWPQAGAAKRKILEAIRASK